MKYLYLIPLTIILFFNVGQAQEIDSKFFNQVDDFLRANVKNGLVDYGALTSDTQLTQLINTVSTADVNNLDAATTQAFYINAYNLNVINNIVKNYPLTSVMEVNGFFDKAKVKVANASMTLNELEKEKLLKVYKDSRFHFVLVCGALGCPPITNFAYTPEKLESQLEQQTRIALNNTDFIRANTTQVLLSQIFKWYSSDFGSTPDNILKFINKYRETPIPASAKIKHYNYDWKLNGLDKGTNIKTYQAKSSNEFRYIVSSTIPKGTVELKIFNNLYSQKTGLNETTGELSDRSSFFTTTISAFYGLSDRVNVGINARVRKIRNNPLPSSPFTVFGSEEDNAFSSRSGLTALGPQIRYAPVPKWENFSIQSSFVFAIGSDLDGGSGTQPYIDWDGATWWTQFFNDFSIGDKFSLFTEIDLLIEDIGSNEEGHINRISTPAILIFSYIPTTKLTLYTIGGYSPYWQENYDYFYQYGVGTKYQFTPEFELELLYTDFTNKFLSESSGQAETINLGLRINF